MASVLELLALSVIFCVYKIYQATTRSTRTEASAKWDIYVHSTDASGTLVISIDFGKNVEPNTQTGGCISIADRDSLQEAVSNVKWVLVSISVVVTDEPRYFRTPSNAVPLVTAQVQQPDNSSPMQLPTETIKYDPSSPSPNSKATERKESRMTGQCRNQNSTVLVKDALLFARPRPPTSRKRLPSTGPTSASVKDDNEVNPADGPPSIPNPPRKDPLDSATPFPERICIPLGGGGVNVPTVSAESATVNHSLGSRDTVERKEIDVTTPSVQCPYVSPLTARRCLYESSTGRSVLWVEKEWKHWRCHILDEIHSMSHKTLGIGNGTLISSKELFEKYLERDIVCDVCHDILSDKCDLQARVDNLNPNRDHIRVCNFCVMTVQLMGCQLKKE